MVKKGDSVFFLNSKKNIVANIVTFDIFGHILLVNNMLTLKSSSSKITDP